MRLTVRGGHPSPSYPLSLCCAGVFARSRFTVDPMRYWLMKSEPSECSIDDLAAAPDQTVPWVGVRNFQARNFMRDAMQVGDGVLFYHSSCAQPGVAGLATVASTAYPDSTQFNPQSTYFDPGSKSGQPRWLLVDIKLTRKTRLLSLAVMRDTPAIAGLQVLRRGNRLSITPVDADEWARVLELLNAP